MSETDEFPLSQDLALALYDLPVITGGPGTALQSNGPQDHAQMTQEWSENALEIDGFSGSWEQYSADQITDDISRNLADLVSVRRKCTNLHCRGSNVPYLVRNGYQFKLKCQLCWAATEVWIDDHNAYLVRWGWGRVMPDGERVDPVMDVTSSVAESPSPCCDNQEQPLPIIPVAGFIAPQGLDQGHITVQQPVQEEKQSDALPRDKLQRQQLAKADIERTQAPSHRRNSKGVKGKQKAGSKTGPGSRHKSKSSTRKVIKAKQTVPPVKHWAQPSPPPPPPRRNALNAPLAAAVPPRHKRSTSTPPLPTADPVLLAAQLSEASRIAPASTSLVLGNTPSVNQSEEEPRLTGRALQKAWTKFLYSGYK
ncbi:hypothetical protein HDU93_004800 [Gonapodya sp. JEL0774]|nr:hypothetical protein HDU93_004800 [Gonapodya sp. JEL0774]